MEEGGRFLSLGHLLDYSLPGACRGAEVTLSITTGIHCLHAPDGFRWLLFVDGEEIHATVNI